MICWSGALAMTWGMPIRPLQNGPLSNKEIKELDAFLLADDGLEDPMDFFSFDGFFCAVLSASRLWYLARQASPENAELAAGRCRRATDAARWRPRRRHGVQLFQIEAEPREN
jgi:hypothetical protein